MDEPTHAPVDTATAARPRSILKKRDSHDCDSHHIGCTVLDKSTTNSTHDIEKGRGAQWDEMNILATYHPADKDYGHMKIDDPPTPYHEYEEPEDEAMDSSASHASMGAISSSGLRERKASFSDAPPELFDSDVLADKLAAPYQPKVSKSISSDSDDDLTEDALAKKRDFKSKRKHHYNEFQAVQLARKLLEEELDDEEEKEKNEKM